MAAHILAPSSEGLFHRGIMQSGSIFPWIAGNQEAAAAYILQSLSKFQYLQQISRTASEVAGLLGNCIVFCLIVGCVEQRVQFNYPLLIFCCNIAGCAGLDGEAILACLRNRSVEEIMQVALPLIYRHAHTDSEIFFEDSLQRLAHGKLAKVNLLLGVAGDEGFAFVEEIIPEVLSAEPDMTKAEQQLKGYLSMLFPHNTAEIQDLIMEHYFGGSMPDMETKEVKQKTARIFGDLVMKAPTFLHAQYHSGRSTLSFI